MESNTTDGTDGIGTMTGSMMIAHPELRDGIFRRALVLVLQHNANGAYGAILNRPLKKTLGDVAPAFDEPPFDDVPIYEGGPVGSDKLSFCAWNRTPEGLFRIQFGLRREDVGTILQQSPHVRVRAIFGCAKWVPGQLENEFRQRNIWLQLPKAEHAVMMENDGDALWFAFIKKCSPLLRLAASAPADVSKN